MREFPFSTITTDKDLIFKGYGANLDSGTQLTITIPYHATSLFIQGQSPNNFATHNDFALPALYVDKAMDTGVSTN